MNEVFHEIQIHVVHACQLYLLLNGFRHFNKKLRKYHLIPIIIMRVGKTCFLEIKNDSDLIVSSVSNCASEDRLQSEHLCVCICVFKKYQLFSSYQAFADIIEGVRRGLPFNMATHLNNPNNSSFLCEELISASRGLKFWIKIS